MGFKDCLGSLRNLKDPRGPCGCFRGLEGCSRGPWWCAKGPGILVGVQRDLSGLPELQRSGSAALENIPVLLKRFSRVFLLKFERL